MATKTSKSVNLWPFKNEKVLWRLLYGENFILPLKNIWNNQFILVKKTMVFTATQYSSVFQLLPKQKHKHLKVVWLSVCVCESGEEFQQTFLCFWKAAGECVFTEQESILTCHSVMSTFLALLDSWVQSGYFPDWTWDQEGFCLSCACVDKPPKANMTIYHFM